MAKVRLCDGVLVELIRVEVEFYKDCEYILSVAGRRR